MPYSSNFDDVGQFHFKFDLDNTTHNSPGPRKLDEKLIQFRLRLLLEELEEVARGCGYGLGTVSNDQGGWWLEFLKAPHDEIEHDKIFDGLLDLAYVTFGMAHLFGYPWQEGWDEVQRANITKERCNIDHAYVANTGEDLGCCKIIDGSKPVGWGEGFSMCGKSRAVHSLRGSAHDVIKPTGWLPPNIAKVLRKYGFDV